MKKTKTDLWGRDRETILQQFHTGWEKGELVLVKGVWTSKVMCPHVLPDGWQSPPLHPAYAAITMRGTLKSDNGEGRKALVEAIVMEAANEEDDAFSNGEARNARNNLGIQ